MSARSAVADRSLPIDRPLVDVVIVTFNSEKTILECVRALDADADFDLIVVDNASSDGCVGALRRSRVRLLPQTTNLGFAAASNIGWRAGVGKYVLFLNPDAVIDPTSVRRLVHVLEHDPTVGVAVPRFVYPSGRLAHYLRRFPRLASTFAQALYVHHLLPRASWASEVIADAATYDDPGPHDWAPGACLMARRSLIQALDGFDERFFMYCEDKDLCKRAWEHGFRVWYDPEAICVHEGGASAPRASLLPVRAESRMVYLSKHSGRMATSLHRIGLVLDAVARLVVSRGGSPVRAGHARALVRLLKVGR